jgi:tRNA modification GTPase
MFSTDDTIAAVATPPGRGGLGVIRLSGPEALAIACALAGREGRPLQARRATLARVRALGPGAGAAVAGAFDRVICTFFPAPHSYTGQDVVELSAHGSPVVLHRILAEALTRGARLAQPGEFTLRAFLGGKMDLVQAEAVADLVDAVTPAQARAAFDQLEGTLTDAIRACEQIVFELISRLEASLDFPEEGYHFIDRTGLARELGTVCAAVEQVLADARGGRLLREGAHVVVAGRPNVGKSSLFNALVGSGRAIVTPIPGTTRDLLREQVAIEGVPVSLVDTAGLRPATDVVEQEGVSRARSAVGVADLVLVVLDRSVPLTDEDLQLLQEVAPEKHAIVVVNKIDLAPAWQRHALSSQTRVDSVEVSALTGTGIERLRHVVTAHLTGTEARRDTPVISNIRHIRLLERARTALTRAREVAGMGASEEFVLADLAEASDAFGEVTGRRTTDELLAAIFSRFCIGK